MIYKEILKFLTGAFFWDGIVALWAVITKMYPIRFFGINFTQNGLMLIFFLDMIATLIVAYFAWVFPEKKFWKSLKKQTKKSSRKK